MAEKGTCNVCQASSHVLFYLKSSLLGGTVDGDGVDFLGEDVAVVVSGHSGGGVEEYQGGGKTYKVR